MVLKSCTLSLQFRTDPFLLDGGVFFKTVSAEL